MTFRYNSFLKLLLISRVAGVCMIPIISIVGKSDSGKTTLIEKLVPELTRRGYRVATVKHDIHGFEVDREGKDSWRHKQAGAHTVVISSPQKIALIRDVEKDLTLDEIREKMDSGCGPSSFQKDIKRMFNLRLRFFGRRYIKNFFVQRRITSSRSFRTRNSMSVFPVFTLKI